MSKIYAIRNTSYDYKVLDYDMSHILDDAPEEYSVKELMSFHRYEHKMSVWWQVPVTKFVDQRDGEESPYTPDICQWFAGSSLVLSPKAHRFLFDMLKGYGEFLPVKVDKDTYYIFNCYVIYEPIAEKTKHHYYEGQEFGLKYIEFDEGASNHFVFVSEVDNYKTLYCSEKFKNAVEDFGLKGIILDAQLIGPQLFDDRMDK